MNNIKVSILGADGYVCQIPRIKEGMEALGHVLSEESPDLIYSNDPRGYEKALLLKKKYPKIAAYLHPSIQIFTCLFVIKVRDHLIKEINNWCLFPNCFSS